MPTSFWAFRLHSQFQNQSWSAAWTVRFQICVIIKQTCEIERFYVVFPDFSKKRNLNEVKIERFGRLWVVFSTQGDVNEWKTAECSMYFQEFIRKTINPRELTFLIVFALKSDAVGDFYSFETFATSRIIPTCQRQLSVKHEFSE